MTDTELCIRCNEKIPIGVHNWGEYVTLTFHQESGALPICQECFEEVRCRDLWA